MSRRTGWKARYRVIWWSLAAPVMVLGAAGSLLGAGAAATVLLAFLGAAGAWVIAYVDAELGEGSHREHALLPQPRLCLYGAAVMLSFAGLVPELGGAGLRLALLTAGAGWPTFRHRDGRAATVTRLSGQLAPWTSHYPDVPLRTDTAAGDPAGAVLAATVHARLVVVGTRLRSAAASALLGSTSREILRRSPVPVIVFGSS